MGTFFKDNEYTVLSSNIGEGYIEALVWSTGRATILWDGRNHIDINIVASQHLDSDNARHFVNNFKEHFPDMKIIYNEDIPRGIGRVITSRTNASKPYFSTA